MHITKLLILMQFQILRRLVRKTYYFDPRTQNQA